MAIGDSLEKLIAAHRAGHAGGTKSNLPALKQGAFAPTAQQLRRFLGGIDARYIKSRLTKDRAVIRIGNGEIDIGWDISLKSSVNGRPDEFSLKLSETRNFMSDDAQVETKLFPRCEPMIEYLEAAIAERIELYGSTPVT